MCLFLNYMSIRKVCHQKNETKTEEKQQDVREKLSAMLQLCFPHNSFPNSCFEFFEEFSNQVSLSLT